MHLKPLTYFAASDVEWSNAETKEADLKRRLLRLPLAERVQLERAQEQITSLRAMRLDSGSLDERTCTFRKCKTRLGFANRSGLCSRHNFPWFKKLPR